MKVESVLASQPMLVEAEAPVKVFGDIHGQFRDMLMFFARFGFPQALSAELFTMCPVEFR